MNYSTLLKKIPNEIVSRKDILEAYTKAFSINPSSTVMRYTINNLVDNDFIKKISYNKYIKNDLSINPYKKIYTPLFSEEALSLKKEIDELFPFIDYQIYDLNILNEFMNHLIARNVIFLEVEKDSYKYVFTVLNEKHNGDLLLHPTSHDIDYYFHNNIVVVDRLISESPRNILTPHEIVLEKLIVDMFANKTLRNLLSQSDYPDALETMFNNYEIDIKKLFRYARRRNKENEIKTFITKFTDIKL